MKVLQITVHLFPNIGGVETHLNDLFNYLVKKEWKVFVLAYQPLSTKTNWKIIEISKRLTILRIPWFRGFFEKLVSYPILEFIYLVPGLFFFTPFVVLFYKPKILHAHGISAAVSTVFWGRVFGIKKVVSLHSIYSFPKKGLYKEFVKLILSNCDFVLSLSKKSNQEIQELGIEKNKTDVFTYWINLYRFKKIPSAKKILGWDGKFVVLFVGRLIEEKGIKQLLEAASTWGAKINLVIVGSGPMEGYILKRIKGLINIFFAGKVSQDDLPTYYSAADCTIIPSISEEGFGRVIIESLACETPVIASNKGAIREAMDETVGKFIQVTPENIKAAVYYFHKNPEELKKLSQAARKYVERRNSKSNVETIIKAYRR